MLAAFAEETPSQTDTLNGIGHAFFATLDRDGRPAFAGAATVVALALIVLLIRWVRREARRDRIEQAALDARHQTALSEAPAGDDHREWIRVPAHVRMTLQHTDGHHRFFYEDCETQNVGAGGLAFLSHTPPPSGLPLHFTIDLGEKRPISLQGIVVRVESPSTPDAPSLVAVKLGPITPAEREHVVRWVSHEETREIAEAHRGRLCSFCGRPLAEGAGETHSSCATLEARGEA
jgi:hypothetical protein